MAELVQTWPALWRLWWERFVGRLRPARLAGVPVDPGGWWPSPGAGAPTAYAALYRSQPHVQTVVDFLAVNLGQLNVKAYRRLADNDRVPLDDHPVALVLQRPNPWTTRVRFITELVADYCVYGNAVALKRRPAPGGLELYRIPWAQMTVAGDLVPRAYTWQPAEGTPALTFLPSEILHLRRYSPDVGTVGVSPLEGLRALLAEETAATEYRGWFWRNAARPSGYITRPKDAPRWSEDQKKLFRDQFGEYQGPAGAGKTIVLEEGMEFSPVTASARDIQLAEMRKLTREEVAAAYHVPPAMIGIVEAQGYGSVREQHKALYQDTLGPLIAMLESDFMLQLLTEFSDVEDVYLEFNIAEKLQGSFIEETEALVRGVGTPYMSVNEGRSRLNLRRIPDVTYDKPVRRLDTVVPEASSPDGESAEDDEPAPAAVLSPLSRHIAPPALNGGR